MYADWKISSRVRFPFAGGRAQQPAWVLHNLDVLTLADEYYTLMAEQKQQERERQDIRHKEW